jgi:SAM-dependent methyltransferase
MIDDRNLYGPEYFDMYYLHDKQREEMYEQERSRVRKRANLEPGRRWKILDIGCGVGGFLSGFDDRWEKYGYEPSEFAAEKACKKGINMIRAFRVVDDNSMDVVVFRGTLQHIFDVTNDLANATRVLKPGGLLVILATPDTDSLVYKLFGKLPALDAPKNWVVFGKRILENILERLGYVNVTTAHPYWGTPYANPAHDFFMFLVSLFFGYRKFAFPGNMMEIYATKP